MHLPLGQEIVFEIYRGLIQQLEINVALNLF